jgi:extradiol dioxygenase family protein
MREAIKDFYGKIIGWIETDSKGNKIVKDFYGKILGRYDKALDKTMDFYGKVLSKGDITAALIWNNNK